MRLSSSCTVFSWLLLLCVDAAYMPLSFSTTKRRSTIRRLAASSNKNDDHDHDTQGQLDEWLDQPFFNPNDYADDDSSLLGKFAQLVKTDYNLAETLYAGCFLAFMIIVSQEMFRFQIHGDQYTPFLGTTNMLWNN